MMTLRQIRRSLVRWKCSPKCKGWDVFDTATRGLEIQRCDDCARVPRPRTTITPDDSDVARLPEAKRALLKAIPKIDPVLAYRAVIACEAVQRATDDCTSGARIDVLSLGEIVGGADMRRLLSAAA